MTPVGLNAFRVDADGTNTVDMEISVQKTYSESAPMLEPNSRLDFRPANAYDTFVPDEEQVMAVERRWVQAHRDLDTAAIDAILDEDYKRIQGDEVVSKQAMVASYASGQRHWNVAEGSDYSVQVFDTFAVVIGIWRGVGVNQGEPFDYRARFISIYVKRQAHWTLFRDEVLELG